MVTGIQKTYGGSGVVVSLYECLERYAYLRHLLPANAPVLPPDPRELREWALVMVLTGVLGAIDRGLIPAGREVIIHGSGSYSVRDYKPIARDHTSLVSSSRAIFDQICAGDASVSAKGA
jgi:Family of unknown function (DUF6002)